MFVYMIELKKKCKIFGIEHKLVSSGVFSAMHSVFFTPLYMELKEKRCFADAFSYT